MPGTYNPYDPPVPSGPPQGVGPDSDGVTFDVAAQLASDPFERTSSPGGIGGRPVLRGSDPHSSRHLANPAGRCQYHHGAGDTMIVVSDGSSNARVFSYTVAATAPGGGGGPTLVDNTRPTTDVASIEVTGLSGYDIVTIQGSLTFLIACAGSA